MVCSEKVRLTPLWSFGVNTCFLNHNNSTTLNHKGVSLMTFATYYTEARMKIVGVKESIQNKAAHVGAVAASAGASLLAVGAGEGQAIGNYTTTVSSLDITTASGGILTGFGILVDMLTLMGNWYVTNAMGQLYIAMACLMFVFILIKSLFRHSGGRKR